MMRPGSRKEEHQCRARISLSGKARPISVGMGRAVRTLFLVSRTLFLVWARTLFASESSLSASISYTVLFRRPSSMGRRSLRIPFSLSSPSSAGSLSSRQVRAQAPIPSDWLNSSKQLTRHGFDDTHRYTCSSDMQTRTSHHCHRSSRICHLQLATEGGFWESLHYSRSKRCYWSRSRRKQMCRARPYHPHSRSSRR